MLADTDSTFIQFNTVVYEKMWGPSEFTATGPLKTFERAESLRDLTVPVLFTTGRYDEATPETVAYYDSLTPDSRLVVLENSAYITMQDEPERYVEAVREIFQGDRGGALTNQGARPRVFPLARASRT